MIHEKRAYAVGDMDSLEQLAEKLADHSWTLCTGFRTPAGLLWLNDAFGEDSAQEYAVLVPTADPGVYDQIESITASWCSKDKLLDYAQRYERGERPIGVFAAGIRPRLEPAFGPDAHRCPRCM